MADYDWLESEEFKKSIGQRVIARARAEGFNVESSVSFLLIVYLDHYSDENRRSGLLKESKRREQADALESVDVLMKEAAENARDRKSKTISMADMRRAHKEKYYSVWPFCGKGRRYMDSEKHDLDKKCRINIS